MAYVVRRCEFDQSMARRAVACGADYHLGVRCVGLKYEGDCVKLSVLKREPGGGEIPMSYRARAVVLATGVRYGLIQDL